MTPTPCMVDVYHSNSLPPSTYAGDVALFTAMAAGGWPFLVHKATQGSDDQDNRMIGRLTAAAGVQGLNLGIYHFMDASPIHMQITNFMSAYMKLLAAAPKDTFIRLAVDNEPFTLGLPVTAQSDALAMQMAQFMQGLTGRFPLIYGDAQEFYGTASCNWLGQCPRWLAKYGPWAASHQWGPYWSAGQWQQFSGDGVNTMGINVPGLGVNYDMSAFSGPLADAIQTWSM